jgi:hypothetical protein
MPGIKILIVDYTNAAMGYHGTDPLLYQRRAQLADRAASAALAIAARCTEHQEIWCEIGMEWADRAHPQAEATA